MDGSGPAVFTFESTHMALQAEEVARDRSIPHEVIPTPPGLGAGLCDLALATLPDRVDELARALAEGHVVHRRPADVTGTGS